MGYLQYKFRKLEAKLQRVLHAPRTTHPAFTRPLIGLRGPRVERLEACAAPSDELLRRICACFRNGRLLNDGATPSMWDAHEAIRAPLIAALAGDDIQALRALLLDLFGGNLIDGMSHGNRMFADERLNPYSPRFVALRTIDCLHSLAEATGEKPAPSFAQMGLQGYLSTLKDDDGALLARLERRIGFGLDMPAVGRPYICRLGGCATAPDILRHAYLAHRLREMGYGPDSRVLEIGGGFGMLALCARRAGIGHVTIIDLPFVNAIQMGYLGTALGSDEVSGVTEEERPVRLLPPDAIAGLPDNSFDIVVNCDSLPEMGRATAGNYLREIRRLAPCFLSINQEAQKVHQGLAQNLVPALVDEVGGFRRRLRFRHWMEQGYVEELYERC